MKEIFETTYRLCQDWELRKFSLRERLRDTRDETWEMIEAIIQKKRSEEIGMEYGDVLFTIIRHGQKERIRLFSRVIFYFMPKKICLQRKLKVFQERDIWWMRHYGFHCIRNYHNKEKREKIIRRHEEGREGQEWIK
ncbi:hypothetical protein KKC60_05505 [Patescibacteria group bacterium]|nr:hypothetical protein [Patescibacteria group bacterium]